MRPVKSGSGRSPFPEIEDEWERLRWLLVHIRHRRSVTNIRKLGRSSGHFDDTDLVDDQNHDSEDDETREYIERKDIDFRIKPNEEEYFSNRKIHRIFFIIVFSIFSIRR